MTAFVDWQLETAHPTKANVLGDTVLIQLGPVEDTLSRQSGNKDGLSFCGERAYRIVSGPSFITLGSDGKSMQLAPT